MTKENKKKESADIEDIALEAEDLAKRGDTTAEGNDEGAIGDNIANLTEEVAKWQDKYVRLSAEFDNFRKRTLKEKMDLIESASEDVLRSVLVIMDDMDRAVEANDKSADIEVVKKGTALIHKKLSDLLRAKGVCEVCAMDCELDTDLHEAIAKFPVEDESKKGKIIDVVEKGYKLKEKVIRYSKVVVGE